MTNSAGGNQRSASIRWATLSPRENTKETMLGGLLSLTVVRDPTAGNITTEAPGILPVITHFENGGKNCTYPLETTPRT